MKTIGEMFGSSPLEAPEPVEHPKTKIRDRITYPGRPNYCAGALIDGRRRHKPGRIQAEIGFGLCADCSNAETDDRRRGMDAVCSGEDAPGTAFGTKTTRGSRTTAKGRWGAR